MYAIKVKLDLAFLNIGLNRIRNNRRCTREEKGLATYEFGIVDNFIENKWYSDYTPKKYNCTFINDDLFEEIWIKNRDEFRRMRTYFQVSTQRGVGLDQTGVTLIPPKELGKFYDILIRVNRFYKSEEIHELTKKVLEAMKKEKYMIVYGI